MTIRLSTGSRPTLDAFLMAATLKGDAAEGSKLELHNAREAQALSLDEEGASLGGLPKRMKKLVGTAWAPAGIRECMDSGRGLNILGQSD